jgi:acyl carrier protein
MESVSDKIVEILKKNMKEPPETIAMDTNLSDLEIESLDLAVIVFDIEDAFGIQIPYNANEEMTDFATVGSVVERVQALVSEKDGAAGAAA